MFFTNKRNIDSGDLLQQCKKNTHIALISCIFAFCPTFSKVFAYEVPVPVTTDSRIKTFVYNENEVFNVVTHYGYQSNIEFSNQETIDTISVGNRVPFQIVPSGKRLFIRAQTANARTNMTVVTNKRTYQFDIAAVPAPVMPNEELVYVIRFFYPDDRKNNLSGYSKALLANDKSSSAPAYNYKYTYTGTEALAPVKVFDDGKSTFFKFSFSGIANTPRFYSIDSSGRESFINPQISGEYYMLGTIAEHFAIQRGDDFVSVYNESRSR